MSKEKRKYPRFDTNLEVVFYDQKRTRGKLVNISKKGCMLAIERGNTRPIGSLITFRVFFEGKALLQEGTSPNISLRKVNMEEEPIEPSDHDPYPTSVKILARVARHLEYDGKPSMGIQLMELEERDLQKWSNYLRKKNSEQIVMPYAGPDETTLVKLKPKIIKFVIQFKTLDLFINYFPKKEAGYFFIPSNPISENSLIKLSLTHPENNSKLEFMGIVAGYGPYSKTKNVNGVFVRYENLDEDLKNQIHLFLNKIIYPT